MRILSGIQPSGVLHIGNYFGMMRPAIALQAEGEAFYFIADYHALTSLHNPEAMRENSRRVALDFLACGLDPERGALFRQSDVPQVTELAWILSTVTPMGLLERAHSYKDKTARGMAASAGLFTYPVLMAADILLYDSDVVPVGKDQKQHLEITRDIAIKINETFGSEPDGQIFKLPEPRIQTATEVVPGLDGQKIGLKLDRQHPDTFLGETECSVAACAIQRGRHHAGVKEAVLLRQFTPERHSNFDLASHDVGEPRANRSHVLLGSEAIADHLLETWIFRFSHS